LAEHRDPGQVCADVIVQVRGDSRPHGHDLEEPRHARTIEGVRQAREQQDGGGPEPPALPDRRQDREGEAVRVARHAVSVPGAGQEPVPCGSQTGVHDPALFRGAAPVRAAALQFDLIAEPLPWTETGRHIVDFEGIAVPWELEVLQLRLAERRDVLWLTRDTDATDDNRWRARGRIVRGNDSDHPGAVAEPQSSRTIPKGGVQFA